MARTPKLKKVLPKTAKAKAGARIPSVAEVLDLVEMITEVARRYVTAIKTEQGWPPTPTEGQRRDAASLALVSDFVRSHVASEPVKKHGRLVIRRRDIDVVTLRRVLGALFAEEGDLTPDERVANRLLAFAVHGSGTLTAEQRTKIRTFEIELNSDGKPTLPPSNAAATLIGIVYKRSRGVQDAARAIAGHSKPHKQADVDERELLRFFVNGVLHSGGAPEVAEAVIEAFQRARGEKISRSFARGTNASGDEEPA